MASFAGTEYYRDAYGCTASLRLRRDGMWNMTVRNAHGNPVKCNSPYLSHKAARIALGKMSDGTMRLIKKEA